MASFLQRDAGDCGFCLEQLDIKEANLVGWSDGGITGLCLAANEQYNDRVSKLIIWGSNATMTENDRTRVEHYFCHNF